MNRITSNCLTPLISDQITNNHIPDEKFVTKIVDMIVNKLGLHYYVRDLKFRKDPWNGTSDIRNEYDYGNRIIYINIRAGLEFFSCLAQDINLDKDEMLPFLIDNVARVVLHELEHPNQMSKVAIDADNPETLVLKAALLPRRLATSSIMFDKMLEEGYTEKEIYNYLDVLQKLYYEYYDYCPYERLAEHYAHEAMAAIFKEIGKYPNISYYECFRLCFTYFQRYNEDIIPTKYYLDKLGLGSDWAEIEKASAGLDLKTRLSLGLEISDSEYIYLDNTVASLRARVLK